MKKSNAKPYQSSADLAQIIFKSAADGKKLAEKRKRQMQKEGGTEKTFPFASLPFDLQENILRYLPASEIGMCCAVCKSWGHIYQGAVASIFAQVVGVARGRSKLMRRAELQLVHRLRNTHQKDTAIETALWAAFNGYVDYVLRLLSDRKAVIAVNTTGSTDWDSATLLHVACRQGNIKLVRALLDLEADPAALTKSKQTPLLLAADYGFDHVVDLLLKRCGRTLVLNAQDSSGRTALFAACEKGHVEVVNVLVDWADMIQQETGEADPILDLNLGTVEKGSPLCIACRNGQTKIVKRLLESPVSVNTITEDGRTAFYCAVERGAINTTKLILEKRPPINGKEMTKLLYKARPHAGMEAATQLAETEREVPNVHPSAAGVLVDFASNTGKTPVFVAAERGNLDLLQILLEARVDTNKPTFLNKTPLYAATENGHTEVVRSLLPHCTREQVLHQTNFGTTAPFMAQRNGHMQIKNLLSEFCMEKLTVEKSKKKRSKKRQDESVNRLFKKEKKPEENEGKALADSNSDQDECQTEQERLDKDVIRSQEIVSSILANIETLEENVDVCFRKIQLEGRGGIPNRPQRVTESIISPEPTKMPPQPPQSVEGKDSDGRLDFDDKEDPDEDQAEIKSAFDDRETRDEEDKEGDVQTDSPKDVEPSPSTHTDDEEEDIESHRIENETGNSNRSESCNTAAEGAQDTSVCAPRKPAAQKPTKEELRRERALYFEQQFAKKEAESPPEQGKGTQLNSSRLVPKKEKDVLAARKWSETFIDAEDRGDAAQAGSIPDSLTLKVVRSALLNFSSITSSYKMTEEIFERSFANDVGKVREIFDLMKGSKEVANAWDVFVASTLSTNEIVEDKLGFCFGLFDAKSQGVVDSKVVKTMIKCCCKAISKLKNQNNIVESKEEMDSMVSDLVEFGQTNGASEEGEVSRPHFIQWTKDSPQGRRIFSLLKN